MLKRTVDRLERAPRGYKPFIPWREPQWRPPAGYVRYLLRLDAPHGRPYGAKVIVAADCILDRRYVPGLVGRVANQGHQDWARIGDHELLVDFGVRGIVRFSREHLRLDQD